MKNPAETWQVQRRSRIELDVVLPRAAPAGSSSLAMLEGLWWTGHAKVQPRRGHTAVAANRAVVAETTDSLLLVFI